MLRVDFYHCMNESCPLAKRCWRFAAPKVEGDIIMEFLYQGDKCQFFYPFE
jgi:hypothetical protein